MIAQLPIRRGPGSRTVRRSTRLAPGSSSSPSWYEWPSSWVAAADGKHDRASLRRGVESVALRPGHVPRDRDLVAVLPATDVEDVG